MSFQIKALNGDQFQHLFTLSDEQLDAMQAQRMTVTACPDKPCRISLEDAPVGEEVILLHYQHQACDSPYRSSHAIYVRQGVEQASPATGEIPAVMRHRLIAVRGFDAGDAMIEAEIAEGTELETAINQVFANPAVTYIHLHYAKAGCYAARVNRA